MQKLSIQLHDFFLMYTVDLFYAMGEENSKNWKHGE